MHSPVKFDIKFNFDTLSDKSFAFVCKSDEYEDLCAKLGERFERFEIKQFNERSVRDNLFPDERLYRNLTSKTSIFREEKYTNRESNNGIKITISRAKDNSWIFEVEDLSREKHTFSDYWPGEYSASVLFQSIGSKYAFG